MNNLRLSLKQYAQIVDQQTKQRLLQRTGKLIAEGAVQAMERDLVKLKGGDRHATGEVSGNAITGGVASESTHQGAAHPTKRGMNGLETAYAQHLELRKKTGEVLWWRFNSMRLKLGEGAWFKPDFCVLGYKRVIGGEIPALEFHETKGHWREAARVRIKVAADLYPFRFVAVKRVAGGWTVEEF